VQVLSIIHGPNARSGVFGEVVRSGGHDLIERSYAFGEPPPEPPETYDAVMVFGGAMNVHEVDGHPWLTRELQVLERLLEDEVPVLGVCLGSQMLAAAAGAKVSRAPEPEIGWYEIETMPEAADDPLLGSAPARFTGFQWHSYQFDRPAGAVVLARSPICLQAYRIGRSAWGIQFHAEVAKGTVSDWISQYGTDPDAVRTGFAPAHERERLESEIDRWNDFGRTLAGRFLGVAQNRLGLGVARASA
jgi:GMP synthase (glutamine-hydrolysing)